MLPIESKAVFVTLDFQSTPMNIHVNINLHQQSGFVNEDNQPAKK
jgi:hypothetical protein